MGYRFNWISLYNALKNGNCDTVNHALSEGWDFRLPMKTDHNGLELAAAFGQTEVMGAIIHSRCMCRLPEKEKENLLTLALSRSCMAGQSSSVDFLFTVVKEIGIIESFKENVNRHDLFDAAYVGGSGNVVEKLDVFFDRFGCSPIMRRDYERGHRETLLLDVKRFHERDEEVKFDNVSQTKINSLHLACALGDMPAVKEEIDKQDDWFTISDGTNLGSVFCVAGMYGDVQLLAYLVDRVNTLRPPYFDLYGQMDKVINLACKNGDVAVVKWVTENFVCHRSFNSSWETRLADAVTGKDTALMEFIIDSMVRRQMDSSKKHAASLKRSLQNTLDQVCRRPDVNVLALKYLIELVDVDWKSSRLLCAAVEAGYEVVSFLIDQGAIPSCDLQEKTLCHRFFESVFSGLSGRRCLPLPLIELALSKLVNHSCTCAYVDPMSQYLGTQSPFLYDGDIPLDVAVCHSKAVLKLFINSGFTFDSLVAEMTLEDVLGCECFLEQVMVAKLLCVADWIDLAEIIDQVDMRNMFGILSCQSDGNLERDIMVRNLLFAMCGSKMTNIIWRSFYAFITKPSNRHKQFIDLVNKCGFTITDDWSEVPKPSELAAVHRDVQRLGDPSMRRNQSLKSLSRIAIHRQLRACGPGPKSDKVAALEDILPRSLIEFLQFSDVVEEWEKPDSDYGRIASDLAQDFMATLLFQRLFGGFGEEDEDEDYEYEYGAPSIDSVFFDEEDEWEDEDEVEID